MAIKLERKSWLSRFFSFEGLLAGFLPPPPAAALYVLGFRSIPRIILDLSTSSQYYHQDLISLAAILILVLTCVLGTVSPLIILALGLKPTENLRRWLRPSKLLLMAYAAICVLSLLVITSRSPTSKVTYMQYRGIPVPFLTLYELRGPAFMLFLQEISPIRLLLDMGLLYLVAASLNAANQGRRLTPRCSGPGQGAISGR